MAKNFFETLNTEVTFGVFREYLLTRILPQLNEDGQKKLQVLAEVDPQSITFYENYGCAIIFSPASYGVSTVPQIAIVVIALDPWKFSCSRRKGSDYVMTSSCVESSYLSVGKIDEVNLKTYMSSFHHRLSEASKSAGHQRTPGFILSILQNSFSQSDSRELRPCPGFTDVGQHSGQVPSRDTRWSLVQMVTKHLLMTNVKSTSGLHDYLFDECLALFYSEKAFDILRGIKRDNRYSTSQIDNLFELLEESILTYSRVIDGSDFQCEVPSFGCQQYELKCSLLKTSVEKVLEKIDENFSKSFHLVLPSFESNSTDSVPIVPHACPILHDDARQRALDNLVALNSLSDPMNLLHLLSWV